MNTTSPRSSVLGILAAAAALGEVPIARPEVIEESPFRGGGYKSKKSPTARLGAYSFPTKANQPHKVRKYKGQ